MRKRQQEIYDYIKNFIIAYGYPPTVREIGNGVNLKSTSSVTVHLSSLKKMGYIDYKADSSRTITLCGYEIKLEKSEGVPELEACC